MKRGYRLSFVLMLTLALFMSGGNQGNAAVPIFPGAQGFGIDSSAGRGGQVIKVTNLNSDGPGSLRAALEAEGPRIIVFEVGGVIDLQQNALQITEPYVTIAGQTAPSPGITIIRGGMEIRTHDVLMKHIRFRMGDAGAEPGSGFEPDVTTYGGEAYNIVIDHCSFSWGVDENLSVSGSRDDGPGGTSHRVTLSNNIISEALHDSIHEKGPHSKGTLVHDYAADIAVIGNLYAHNDARNPWFKGFTSGVIVNNAIYNPGEWAIRLAYIPGEWEDSGIQPENPKVSIVGNYMKHGADTPSGLGLVGTNYGNGDAYLEDNIALDTAGNAVPITFGGITVLDEKPSWPEGLEVMPADEVVDHVVKNAGARPADRDRVDQRIIAEFLNGGGRIIDSQNDVGGYPDTETTYRALDVPDTNVYEWLHGFSQELEGGGTAGGSTEVIYEAEVAAGSGTEVETEHGGYTGGGYVNFEPNEPGGYIEWNANAANAGDYTLEFRYANGSGDNRPAEIRVNGNVVESNLSFPSTDAWDSWDTVSLNVSLSAGDHAIRLTGIGSDGGANIDHLRLIEQ